VDLQNEALVRCLLSLGADAHSITYGGFTPYHLTYGRHNEEIRGQLYERTPLELRDLPDSESEDYDQDDMSDEEVSFPNFGIKSVRRVCRISPMTLSSPLSSDFYRFLIPVFLYSPP